MTSSDSAAASVIGGGRPLSPDDFVVLNDEIRAFVRAGIPLDVGLRGTAGRTDGALAELSDRLATRLHQGSSVEDVMAAEGDRLPAEYRAILAAGVRTGRLDDVLASVSELAESTTALKRQLRLSIIYPAVVFVIAYGLFAAFVMYFVPILTRTYILFEIETSPWITVLEWLHGTVTLWGVEVPLVVSGILLLVWLRGRILGRSMGGEHLGRLVPGKRYLSLARFARVLSLLVDHGVPLPEACRLSGQAAGDKGVEGAAQQLTGAVESGASLESALEGNRALPPFLRWLIVVGERQGSLAASLRQAADVYEQRALSRLDWFRRVVPPATVVACCGTITLLYGLTLFVPMAELIKRLGAG